MKKLYPIYFHPVYKNAVWGGQKISTFFNRNTKEKKIAESWEISDRKEGMSKVANGFYKGVDLCDLMNLLKNDLTGDHFFKEFPLLIKLIDAHDKLSIQVHPDQKSAKKLKGKPKEEMWYILHAEENASVLVGFKKKMSSYEFKEALKNQIIDTLIHKIYVQKNDAIYVPSRTIHAILKGTLLLEVQQNSNTTYRIHDWGRNRPLHTQEALESLNFEKAKIESDILKKNQQSTSFKAPSFKVEKIQAKKWESFAFHKSFQIFFVLQGEGMIFGDGMGEPIFSGRTFLCPAALKHVELVSNQKEFSFLRITL